MPLYMKCFKCGGWREIPEHPTEQQQFPTGMVKNLPGPPAKPCSCVEDAPSKDE